jgi:hypothetical protein
MRKASYFIPVLFFLMAPLFTINAYAAIIKSVWPRWEVNNPLSKKTIRHDEWQSFLNAHVITNEEGINLVDYANLNAADKQLLNHYIDTLSHTSISNYNRQEQLAFWINLYNAVTVRTVANYYPIVSIEEINISPGLFSTGPWGAKLIAVNNIHLSLDDIEDRIIRSIWNDARTHYALNNASIGSANLSRQAYKGSILEDQLNNAAFTYINSLRGVQVIEGKLVVSKTYEWYSDDFGSSKENIIQHLKQFAKEPLKSQLKHVNSIDNYVYNWHLNGTITQDE